MAADLSHSGRTPLRTGCGSVPILCPSSHSGARAPKPGSSLPAISPGTGRASFRPARSDSPRSDRRRKTPDFFAPNLSGRARPTPTGRTAPPSRPTPGGKNHLMFRAPADRRRIADRRGWRTVSEIGFGPDEREPEPGDIDHVDLSAGSNRRVHLTRGQRMPGAVTIQSAVRRALARVPKTRPPAGGPRSHRSVFVGSRTLASG